MEAVGMIKPTSKAALKTQCLYLCRLDIDKADKMYEFLIKGMENIPDVEPASKSFIDNLKSQSGEVFNWLRENEDMLTKGAEFIKGILGKKNHVAASPLPPIND